MTEGGKKEKSLPSKMKPSFNKSDSCAGSSEFHHLVFTLETRVIAEKNPFVLTQEVTAPKEAQGGAQGNTTFQAALLGAVVPQPRSFLPKMVREAEPC